MRNRVLRAGSAAVLCAVLGGLPAAPSVAATPGLDVVGFQEAGDPVSLIARSASALTTVGVDGVNLTASAASTTPVGSAALKDLAEAHHEHLDGDLLFGNFSNAIDDFSEPLAHKLLGSGAHITAVAAHLAHVVRTQHWDGLSVDLESLLARDRAGLVRFLTVLRADLPAAAHLSICVENNTSAAAYRANGYELSRIGAIVDRVELMAYDEHGPWENTPGPIGALSWQRKGLHVLVGAVPKAKIDLGVAGYGYAWCPHSNDTLTDAQARKLAGVRARWDASVGEWTARLADGSVVWWSDARSYRLRAALARRWQLHGLAVWDLRESDPIRR